MALITQEHCYQCERETPHCDGKCTPCARKADALSDFSHFTIAKRVETLESIVLDALSEFIAWHELDNTRTRPVMAKDTEVGRRMLEKARAAVANLEKLQ